MARPRPVSTSLTGMNGDMNKAMTKVGRGNYERVGVTQTLTEADELLREISRGGDRRPWD